MKVYGVTESNIQSAIHFMDIQEAQTFERLSRNCVQISIRAKTSDSRYARRTYGGLSPSRRSIAICWHGFRDFIRRMFGSGAYRVHTMYGDWESLGEFEEDLPRLARLNMGSKMYPVELYEGNDCQCEDQSLY
jgi:hypothetical protein